MFGFAVASTRRRSVFEQLEPRLLLDGAIGDFGCSDLNGDGNASYDVTTDELAVYRATPMVVSTLIDESDGNYGPGDLSLREALLLAAALPGDDAIEFDAGLAGGTVTLDATLGQLEIDSNVDLRGLGAEQLTIDADGNSRVLHVASGVTAAIAGLTVTGGSTSGNGGGIWNEGTLTITDAVISDCSAGNGGGIYNYDAALKITNTVISGNLAVWKGGGICHNYDTLTVTCSTVSGNTAQDDGGGMYNYYGTLTVAGSTISGNSAEGRGGGFYNDRGTLAVTGSEISGNSADNDGGGVWNYGTLTLANATIAGNRTDSDGNGSGDGGGMYSYDSSPTVSNSIFWANAAATGPNVANAGRSPASGHTGANVVGYNLSGDYPDNMSVEYATTPAIDCSGHTDVHLSFYRWLGVEFWSSDSAGIQVSNDGANWEDVWVHSGGTTVDAEWSYREYDISATADGQPTVYVRWGMGPTDGSVTYTGWNIDDVVVSALLAGEPHVVYEANMDADPDWTFDPGSPPHEWEWGVPQCSVVPTFSHCAVEGSGGSGAGWDSALGTDAGGNIDADPVFADPDGADDDPDTWADNDYHLLFASPCIGAGSNPAAVLLADTTTAAGTTTTIVVADAALYALDDEIEYDNDGVLRTVTAIDAGTNTVTFQKPLAAASQAGAAVNGYGWGDLDAQHRVAYGVVDMGADEYVLSADANYDGTVDGADYTAWADNYNQPGGWDDGDFSGDGFVDGADYTAWADNYESAAAAADRAASSVVAGELEAAGAALPGSSGHAETQAPRRPPSSSATAGRGGTLPAVPGGMVHLLDAAVAAPVGPRPVRRAPASLAVSPALDDGLDLLAAPELLVLPSA